MFDNPTAEKENTLSFSAKKIDIARSPDICPMPVRLMPSTFPTIIFSSCPSNPTLFFNQIERANF